MKSSYKDAEDFFAQIEEREAGRWADERWYGEIDNCDVCSRPFDSERYMIDGPVSNSTKPLWGNLCVVCARKTVPKIQWGSGQLYRNDNGTWRLVGGGPPSPEERRAEETEMAGEIMDFLLSMRRGDKE